MNLRSTLLALLLASLAPLAPAAHSPAPLTDKFLEEQEVSLYAHLLVLFNQERKLRELSALVGPSAGKDPKAARLSDYLVNTTAVMRDMYDDGYALLRMLSILKDVPQSRRTSSAMELVDQCRDRFTERVSVRSIFSLKTESQTRYGRKLVSEMDAATRAQLDQAHDKIRGYLEAIWAFCERLPEDPATALRPSRFFLNRTK